MDRQLIAWWIVSVCLASSGANYKWNNPDGGDLTLSDNYNPKLILENLPTRFFTSVDDLQIGNSGSYNSVVVTNGALFHSGRTLQIGAETTESRRDECAHNGLVVTGSGSRFEPQAHSLFP